VARSFIRSLTAAFIVFHGGESWYLRCASSMNSHLRGRHRTPWHLPPLLRVHPMPVIAGGQLRQWAPCVLQWDHCLLSVFFGSQNSLCV
jgi:hypothetical protein